MFSYIKGVLTASTHSHVVVEVNGVGYLIIIPYSTLTHLPPLGNLIHMHVSFVIREFSHALYGFLEAHEREVFEVLLNVSGIGPKLALSIIGHISLQELQEAITQQNLTLLCKVPGIGKKTAERMVIELRDKLPQINPIHLSDRNLPTLELDPHARQIQDAMMALINLGYNQHSAKKAIEHSLRDHPEPANLAELITLSLKRI